MTAVLTSAQTVYMFLFAMAGTLSLTIAANLEEDPRTLRTVPLLVWFTNKYPRLQEYASFSFVSARSIYPFKL